MEDDVIDLRELGRAMWRRVRLIAGVFITCVLIAFIASQMATPIYEATTTLLLKNAGGGADQFFLEAFGGLGRNNVQNAIQVLQSRSLAERTAQRIGYRYDVYSPEFRAFRDSISVRPVSNTDAIQISVTGPDPVWAAQVANAHADSFAEFMQEMNRQEAAAARVFLEEQQAIMEQQLRDAEDRLQAFRERERAVAPTEESRLLLSRLTDLEVREAETQLAWDETRRRVEEIRRRLEREDPTFVAQTTIANNPMVANYRTRLSSLETELAGLLPRLGEQHPQVQTIRAQIADLENQLAREVERIVTSETITANPIYQELLKELATLETESVLYTSRLEALRGLIAEAEGRLENLPAKEVQLARLMRDRQVAEQVYLLLRNRYEEVRIMEAMQVSNVSVIDPSIVPQRPIRPRKMLNMALAGMLGIMLGVGLALVLEFLDTSVRSAEEVEQFLQVPVVGQIPLMESQGDRPY